MQGVNRKGRAIFNFIPPFWQTAPAYNRKGKRRIFEPYFTAPSLFNSFFPLESNPCFLLVVWGHRGAGLLGPWCHTVRVALHLGEPPAFFRRNLMGDPYRDSSGLGGKNKKNLFFFFIFSQHSNVTTAHPTLQPFPSRATTYSTYVGRGRVMENIHTTRLHTQGKFTPHYSSSYSLDVPILMALHIQTGAAALMRCKDGACCY